MIHILIIEDNITDFEIINVVLKELLASEVSVYPANDENWKNNNRYFITDVVTAVHCNDTHPSLMDELEKSIIGFFNNNKPDYVILDRALEGNEDDLGIVLKDIFISKHFPNAKVILFSQFDNTINAISHNYFKYINKYNAGNTVEAVKQNLKTELAPIFTGQ